MIMGQYNSEEETFSLFEIHTVEFGFTEDDEVELTRFAGDKLTLTGEEMEELAEEGIEYTFMVDSINMNIVRFKDFIKARRRANNEG
jgi:hypothetical protein